MVRSFAYKLLRLFLLFFSFSFWQVRTQHFLLVVSACQQQPSRNIYVKQRNFIYESLINLIKKTNNEVKNCSLYFFAFACLRTKIQITSKHKKTLEYKHFLQVSPFLSSSLHFIVITLKFTVHEVKLPCSRDAMCR